MCGLFICLRNRKCSGRLFCKLYPLGEVGRFPFLTALGRKAGWPATNICGTREAGVSWVAGDSLLVGIQAFGSDDDAGFFFKDMKIGIFLQICGWCARHHHAKHGLAELLFSVRVYTPLLKIWQCCGSFDDYCISIGLGGIDSQIIEYSIA